METISSRDKNTLKNYIAFFDLDQTLANSVSGRSLAISAFRKGLLTNPDLLKAIFLSLMFRFKLREHSKIINDMVGWVRGITEESMAELCSEVSNRIIIPSVYTEAITEIEIHKAKNARVVILSSAITNVCREVSEHLKIDDIICSELEIKNGYLTGHPIGHICYGGEKAVRLKEYCEKNNSSPSESWYYGDSISDFPVLSIVGNPVCVNPDNKLKRTALKRGWQIRSWKN
jgi:HAD superfamily hydrolase (TIGR01490 family)